MAAARTAARGLSTSDLERIRDALATGRRPKVVFTEAAGQIAGQQGQVIELTDPQLSDDWLVVRFGRDELPFSPADLEIPPRATPARRAAKPSEPPSEPPSGPPPPEPAAQPLAPPAGSDVPPQPVQGTAVPAPREESTVPVSPTAAPANGKPAPSRVKPEKTPEKTDGPPEPAAPQAKPAARKAARPKPPAALTVTLAYTDGEWTVAAQQGSKALAKPYLIRPAEALKMVGMLDVPGVQEAVEEIVSAARAQAEAQAEKLRVELAEIEARLAELRDTR